MKNRFKISIVFVLLSLGALNAQVGIGTTTPSTVLHVEGGSSGEFGLLSSNLTGTGAGVNFQDQTTTSRFHVGISARGNDMFFRVGNSPQARLDANGLFGIGVTTTPATRLHVESNGAGEFGLLSSNLIGTGAGINFQDQTTTSRFHVGLSARGNDMYFRTGNANQFLFGANGYFGIGILTPRAPIHLANFMANNRQILLYEEANDNHQFYGFGINASVFRYQIGNLSASHVFYGGVNATTSNELFRIRGNGSVGVGGVAAPAARVDVNGYVKVASADTIGDAAPQPGMIRYNNTTNTFQGYVGGATPGWVNLN